MGAKELYFALCTAAELIYQAVNEEVVQAADNRYDREYYCGYSDGVSMLLDTAEELASRLEALNLKEMKTEDS